MVLPRPETRTELRPGGSRHANPLVFGKRRIRIAGRPGDRSRENAAVLDGHAGALTQIGQHRVGRVAKQRDPPPCPSVERVPVVQRPFVVLVAGFDQPQQRRVPPCIGLQQLGPVAFVGPRFSGPAVAVVMGDEIDQTAGAANRIMHDMAVRSPPRDHLAGEARVGERLAGHQAAPANATREARFDMAENTVADRRMDPVRADHDIRFDGCAIGEMGHRAACAGLGARALGSQMKHAVGQRRDQQGQQIRAVHGQKRRTVARGDIAGPLRPGDHAAAAEAADDLFLGLAAGLQRGVFDAEISECLQRVGAEIEARPDFPEFGGLLVDRDLETASMQRQRRRRAAKPAADDGYSGRRHGAPAAPGNASSTVPPPGPGPGGTPGPRPLMRAKACQAIFRSS